MEQPTKEVKKKIKIKIIPFLLVILLSVSLFFIGKHIINLPITNIYISGNINLKDQEIIELATIESYPSFILTSTSSIEKKIKKNDFIKTVNVTKKLFGKIIIDVTEYKPLYREETSQKIVLGNKKRIDDLEYNYQLPILLNYVPENKMDSFIKGMNITNDSIKTQISEITYSPNEQDKDRFLLYMTDGNYVYLTLTKFKQINYYTEVLEQLGDKKGILYLDSGNHFQIMEG
ncbi:MAG: FtsQ-type POTRA domain-containing protein [Firmicutes bacterium]|nr:FtsQ-type POTRA domain-containing protein [Bacillota bacterium]